MTQEPFETLFIFDGRSRSRRRLVSTKVENEELLSEAVLSFLPKKKANEEEKEERVRRTVLSQQLHETVLIRFGASRAKIESGAALYGTVTDKVLMPSHLPRIRQSSKRALLNIKDKDMPMAPPGMGDDESVPLWWGESKSTSFWESWIQNWKGALIIDLKATTQLPNTCLKLGVPYLGITANEERLVFMNNIADLHALQSMVKQGHCLYEQDLSTCIKSLFEDELSGVQEKMPDLEDDDD
eukprot:s4885_g3.t1